MIEISESVSGEMDYPVLSQIRTHDRRMTRFETQRGGLSPAWLIIWTSSYSLPGEGYLGKLLTQQCNSEHSRFTVLHFALDVLAGS
jgi:hypothetical protein